MLVMLRGCVSKISQKQVIFNIKKTFTDIKNPLAFFEENPITKIFHTISFNTWFSELYFK